MTTTAGDLIKGSLRLIGQLAEGESPSSETSNDSLIVLNQMLDSWSTERLSIYSTQDQSFTWPASTISRTLGPTGNFAGNRPIELDDSTYFVDPTTGVSYGVKIINQQQYDGIAVKTVTSTYPQVLWVNMDMSNITLYQYPVATRDLTWHFISVTELSQPATLATTITVPPGYMRAFRYSLAVELATEFGIEPPGNVARIAMSSKRNIKRINNPNDVMALPYSLIGQRQRFNVFSGNY